MTWKKRIITFGVIVLVSSAVFGLAASLMLRSQRFHKYMIAKIERQASEATGAQVQIQDFSLHLRLAADAYGITIHGTELAGERPLAQADRLTIRVKIFSLWRQKVALREIILQHPVINLQVSKDGTTNLPTLPKAENKKPTDPFDLGIEHVLLERGELYCNDVKTPLNAELHDLHVEVKSGLAKDYQGTV